MKKSLEERFRALYTVDGNTGCWIWIGYKNHDGYGIFSVAPSGAGSTQRAHRWAYTQKHGPIPEGMELDHYACSRRDCCNPDHCRPTSHRENVLRSDVTQAAINLAKTHCDRAGHLLPTAGNGWRQCEQCRRERSRRVDIERRERWAKARAARQAEMESTPRSPWINPKPSTPRVSPRDPKLRGTLRDGLQALAESRRHALEDAVD